MSGYADGPVPGAPDVVIHFGGMSISRPFLNDVDKCVAYARNMLVPDNETFQANVTSTYNIIEAGECMRKIIRCLLLTSFPACKLGVKKIIIASSETTYGVCFAQGDADYHSFPLEEDYDVDPEDSYVHSPSSHDTSLTNF